MTGATPCRISPPEATRRAPESVKLLLVDDNEENLVALEAALTPLAQELFIARSGQEALRLCLEHDFAAILLDVRMPEMDGFEAAQLVRQRPRSRYTPILFLTAYRSDEHLFRGYDLGAVDFLFKPIVPEILQSKVSVFVELTRNSELLKRQAAGLAKGEKQLRSLLEAAPDAMVITDGAGEMLLVNSRTHSLFGYSRKDLDGRRFELLVPDWRCPELPPYDDADEPAQSTAAVRLNARRLDGSTFPADVTTSVLRSDDTILVTNAIRDMTEQVRAQEDLERINVRLENLVAERTIELTRSNDALRQFAWAASHDLQEPLRVVTIYSQWLSRTALEKLDPSEREFLSTIESHAARMQRLLGALRQYLLVNDADTPAPAEPVSCEAVVQAVLHNLGGILNESGATVEVGPLPVIHAAEVLLVQLFQNLVQNAIKYRSDRPPMIRVNAEARNGEWIFSVSDNGVGIDPQYLDYIFGVFKCIQRDSGAGMGLAICKAAVERIGGRIWAESELGMGATFRFALPRFVGRER